MNSESLYFPQTASLYKANQINFLTIYFKRQSGQLTYIDKIYVCDII